MCSEYWLHVQGVFAVCAVFVVCVVGIPVCAVFVVCAVGIAVCAVFVECAVGIAVRAVFAYVQWVLL